MFKLIPVVIFMLFLSACGLIGGKEDEVVDPTEPVELYEIQELAEITREWRVDVGDGVGDIHSILKPAIDGDAIFATGRGGSVSGYELEDGSRLWRHNLEDVTVTGGVGASNGLVLLGTKDGQVYAIEQSNGDIRWRTTVSSEVLAAPETNGDVVIVATIDGQVFGLEASDGQVRWRSEVSRPSLSLRGNGAPVVTSEVAYVGHDNGKVTAYRTADGSGIWEARVAIPSGRTELEKLVDIDAAPLLYAGVLYAVSFQGGLMSINPETGRGFWYQEASSHNNIGSWGGTIAITKVDGVVRTFNVADGTEIWTSEALKNRGLNAPVVSNEFVAMVDDEGILHVLDRPTGDFLARREVDNEAVRAPMLIEQDTIYLLDSGGALSAWKVTL